MKDNNQDIQDTITIGDNFYAKGDYEKAFESYRHAALNGSGEAAFKLAQMYEKGIGIEVNASSAKQWYFVAAKNGYKDAKKQLTEAKLIKKEEKTEEPKKGTPAIAEQPKAEDTRSAEEIQKIVADFLTDWERAKKDEDIFIIDYYRDNLPNTHPMYPELCSLFDKLREKELAEMMAKPYMYSIDKIKRLLTANIITKQDLLDRGLITEGTWNALMQDQDHQLPRFYDIWYNETYPLHENSTDVYFLGWTPGKTCLLMGLCGAEGRGILCSGDRNGAGLFKEYLENRLVPPANGCNIVLNAYLTDYQKNINLIDIIGHQFIGTVFSKGHKILDDEKWIYLRNPNRKSLLLLIDCALKEDSVIWKYMETFRDEKGDILYRPRKAQLSLTEIYMRYINLFSKPENKEIMDKVDSIHFVVTQVDLIGKTHEEQLRKARNLVQTHYRSLVEAVKAYCRQTKRINASTGFDPCVFTYSLGKFYVGDVYEYNVNPSIEFINILGGIATGNKNGQLNKYILH